MPANPTKLLLPKILLRRFFGYLFYSILPECTIWGKKTSIIAEPICSLEIKNMNIADCKLIHEWLDKSFKVSNIRSYIEDGIAHIDGSDLEQILFPLSPSDILELDDNPIMYPRDTLSTLISDILPKSPHIARHIDGICHFHPTDDAQLSKDDCQTMNQFAEAMKIYGKKRIISLVIAKGDPQELVKKAKLPESQFIQFIMTNLENVTFNARTFYPYKKDESADILLI